MTRFIKDSEEIIELLAGNYDYAAKRLDRDIDILRRCISGIEDGDHTLVEVILGSFRGPGKSMIVCHILMKSCGVKCEEEFQNTLCGMLVLPPELLYWYVVNNTDVDVLRILLRNGCYSTETLAIAAGVGGSIGKHKLVAEIVASI